MRNEFFARSAEVTGAGIGHILTREILPNCVSPIFTKMSLDMGWVIIVGASLSFVGLGVQPPDRVLAQWLPAAPVSCRTNGGFRSFRPWPLFLL